MKNPIIRTIYLYLFSLVGLIVLLFGIGSLINLGLKTFIFTKADIDLYKEPIHLGYSMTLDEQMLAIRECELSEEDKEAISKWLREYEEDDIDMRIVRRQEDASRSISQILVGLPVYLYHWGVIVRDRRKEKNA